jgi:Domain of unknown function (DUF4124)
MRLILRRALLVGLLLLPSALCAQIYTCRGADGSVVFSDEKCGPDAKPVKGFENTKTNKKKKSTKAAEAKPKSVTPARPPEELAALLKQCDAGDAQACNTWTVSGGPNALREEEHQHELACEAGSLADCETRYCKEGANENCRQSVLRTAQLSGDNWYLRSIGVRALDGAQTFDVRCIRKDVKDVRDVTIACSANPRRRCTAAKATDTFDGLREAAGSYCAKLLP